METGKEILLQKPWIDAFYDQRKYIAIYFMY